MREQTSETIQNKIRESVRLQPSDIEGVEFLGVLWKDQTFGIDILHDGKLDGVKETGELSAEDKRLIIDVITEKYAGLFPKQDAEAIRKALLEE